MYHKVTDVTPNTIAVNPSSFRDQQAFLKARYNVVGLDRLVQHLDEGVPLPPRAVLLTFDDGYLNNLEVAYPILQEFGHPAVLFPALNFLDRQTLPHDRHLPWPEPTLNWDELRRMKDVFTIGSHACSHRPLTGMPIDEATEEIKRSKDVLEQRLQAPVIAFSYPKGSIGDFNEQLQAVIQEAGYLFAFTTLPGTNTPPLNRFRVRRHNVEDFGPRFFASLLDGSGDLLALKDTRLGYAAKARARKLLRADHG